MKYNVIRAWISVSKTASIHIGMIDISETENDVMGTLYPWCGFSDSMEKSFGQVIPLWNTMFA